MVNIKGDRLQLLLGAHTSTSGGLYKALEKGNELSCTAIQIFTKSQLRWQAPPFTKDELDIFKETLFKIESIRSIIAHASYLINLASPDNEIVKKSRIAIRLELERSIQLGIKLYVLHPGYHKGIGVEAGIKNLARHLKDLIREYGNNITICIETVAGQGSSIGSNFEEIAEIIDKSGGENLGVCFDTCHVFASGYDIRDKESYNVTMEKLNRIIGLEKVKVIHMNDSKSGLDSKIDRHMHIGRGYIGLEAFKLIMNDFHFLNVPKIIETPKENNPKKYDRMNLDLLRGLLND